MRSNNAHKQVFGDIIDDTTKEGNCKLLLKLERKLSQEKEESGFQILKQRTSGLNKIEEIQEKLKYRFKRIDKHLRKEDLRRSSHFNQEYKRLGETPTKCVSRVRSTVSLNFK